jgi:hypothetical protein
MVVKVPKAGAEDAPANRFQGVVNETRRAANEPKEVNGGRVVRVVKIDEVIDHDNDM